MSQKRILDTHIKEKNTLSTRFQSIAAGVTRATGSVFAFIIAVLVILIWAITGPLFNFSDTWQLVINTGTTIITFLMVFVIQQSQNKDSLAVQLKLNELIASAERASNRLIDIEDLSEEELLVLKKFYIKLSDLAEKENDLFSSHSIDDAEGWHSEKMRSPRRKKEHDKGGKEEINT